MHRKLLFEIHGNSRHRLLFCKYRSMILFQNSQKSTCACASFLIRFSLQAYSPITKGTLSHVFCCEFFSEQFFFIEHLRTVDFEFRLTDCKLLNIILMYQHGVDVGPLDPGSRVSGPPSQFNVSQSKFEGGTAGPPSKCKNRTHIS